MKRTVRPFSLSFSKQRLILFVFCLCLFFTAISSAGAETTVGGTITTDTTWTVAGSPYIVTSNITVQGTDGTDNVTTLTIEPGVLVRLGLFKQLNIGKMSGDPGALVAQGTASNPIMFTSDQASPAPGNWNGIKFYKTTVDTSTLAHCSIQYAGYGAMGSIYINGAAPSLIHCSFANNSYYDLYYTGEVGGLVSECILNSGISLLTYTSSVGFTGNTFNQNNSYPTRTYADNVHALVNDNTFANLDDASFLEVNGGNITKDATWTAAIPLYLNSNLTIKGADGDDHVTTLTIEPGAELRVGLYKQLSVGAASGDPGALVAQGTASNPITFTCSQVPPSAGKWAGVKFYNTTDDDTSKLVYCLIQYGGYGNWGQVCLRDAKPLISKSYFRKSSHAGIFVYGSGCNDVEITENVFSDNVYGIYCISGALPLVHQNNFIGNSSYGVYNSGTGTIDAQHNWWGDSAGPNTGGDATYGNVDADPWLTEKYQPEGALDQPDLIVTDLETDPTGHLQSGQTASLTARLQNRGIGSVENSFSVDFKVDGVSIGAATVNDTILSEGTVQVSHDWVCTGGDPTIQIIADSQSGVSETDETNNTLSVALSDVADMTAPALMSTSPKDLEKITQITRISVTLADKKGVVDDAAVMASFTLVDENQQTFVGNVTEDNDTFTFIPDNLPLPDGSYKVSLTSSDTLGNTQNIVFNFEIIPEPTLVSGTISTDTTWTLDGSPYIVTSSVMVQGTDGNDGVTTLTIEPGVEVRFNRYHYLSIGSSTVPGALVAQGTSENPIVFTANQATPAPGDWQAILINGLADDTLTKLTHCIIEYTGNYKKGAIFIQDAAPTITNCVFQNGSFYDLNYGGDVGGSVSGCTFNNGIKLQTTTSDVAFSGNTIHYNNSFPIITYPEHVHGLVNGNTYTNVGEDSFLEVRSGTISRDATWTAVVPYKVTSAIIVQGTDGSDRLTTLTIAPGAELRFGQYYSLSIGPTGPGAMVAIGTQDNPIIFTSSQTAPSPGDWQGILINDLADDATTIMEHCLVQYAGSRDGSIFLYQAAPTLRSVSVRNSRKNGVYIHGSEPVLENCSFSGNLNYDLYYTDTVGGSVTGSTINRGVHLVATGKVAFSNNTFNYDNNFPIVVFPENVHSLVNGNTFNNLNPDSCLVVKSGKITQDAFWTAAIPLFLEGHRDIDCVTPRGVTVQGTDGEDKITTLTIAPGARLKFNTYSSLDVGAHTGDPGALVAQGTPAQPIVFTSNEPAPSENDWIGIRIYNTANDSMTRLEHCIVEYTGFYEKGAVRIWDAAPALRNCVFNNSGYYDLFFRGTVGGSVENCTINNGIYFMYPTSTVGFSGNTINYNNNRPIVAGADCVHSLIHGNTYKNIDADSFLKVGNSSLTRDATWTSVIPYVIAYGLTVQGADGTDKITTLTLGPGATLKFDSNRFLDVGDTAGEPGALSALGTMAQPVIFTSNSVPQTAGDWYGIRIYDTANDAATKLEHCVVEYAGLHGKPNEDRGAILIKNAAPTLTDCTFRSNDYYDLYYLGTVGGAVSGCTINNNLSLLAKGTVGFNGNTIHHTNNLPIRTYPDSVHGLMNGNTITNLDAASHLHVKSGTLTRDATWTAAIPLFIDGYLTVQGTDGDDEVTTLTIQPGTRLKFGSSGIFSIGGTSGDPGALIAQGTPENMILLTSNKALLAPGAWDAVRFNPTAASTSLLEYCVVEYGGGYLQGGVFLYGTNVPVRHCIIRNNKTYGLYIRGAESNGADISCNTIENNGTGIMTSYAALPSVQHNNFVNNALYGIRSSGLVAENNWWNDPEGPNKSGDKSHDATVDVDPWSTQPNPCLPSGANQQPYTPVGPEPADQAVQVTASFEKALTWSGGDPNPQDVVVYDVRIGTSAESLALAAADLASPTFVLAEPVPGKTYYWQVTARDNHGLETTGALWQFTTIAGPPDLEIGNVFTDPVGNLQNGQSVSLSAIVQNSGEGPVVNSFAVEVHLGGDLLGTAVVDDVILKGQSVIVSMPWTYTGGDPTITITADSGSAVQETNEHNNAFTAALSHVADMTAPSLVSTMPANTAHLKQVDNITISLADDQSAVDDAAVIASITVTDADMHNIAGDIVEADDRFTFTPAGVPMADGIYTVSLTAADVHGNTQNHSFVFTIDSQEPAKPVITGDTVTSGTIRVRPAQNTSNKFVVQLTGTREAGTSVWLNNSQKVAPGDAAWSIQIELQPGANTLEVWLTDQAGNRGESEWVDIQTATADTVRFQYDDAGRVNRIDTTP